MRFPEHIAVAGAADADDADDAGGSVRRQGIYFRFHRCAAGPCQDLGGAVALRSGRRDKNPRRSAQCGPLQIVGTVPPQHMYGFESTLLLVLQGGAVLSAAHPFYPADIANRPGRCALAAPAGVHPGASARPDGFRSVCRPSPWCSVPPHRWTVHWPLHWNNISARPCWKSTAQLKPDRSPRVAPPERNSGRFSPR